MPNSQDNPNNRQNKKLDPVLKKKIAQLGASLGSATASVLESGTASSFYASLQSQHRDTYRLFKRLTKEIKRANHLTHEMEWILDNFYIIEAALSDIQKSIPKKVFRQLPQITTSQGRTLPRVHYVFEKLLKTTKNVVTKKTLATFIEAYQQSAPLSVLELTILPNALKTLLVENIQQLMRRSLTSLKQYEQSRYWHEKIHKEAERKNPNFSELINSLTDEYPVLPLHMGFFLQEKLTRDGLKTTAPIKQWIRLNFQKQGIDSANLSELERSSREANSHLITNNLASLHWINQFLWDDFTAEVNSIDTVLFEDPARFYHLTEAKSRGLFRALAVSIAERSGVHEVEVARLALRFARDAQADATTDPRTHHVGYYLLGEGRALIERELHYRPRIVERVRRLIKRHPYATYFGPAAALTIGLGILISPLIPAVSSGQPLGVLVVVWLALLLILSEIALTLTNTLVARIIPPRVLPRLDLTKGVLDQHKTMVAIPAVLRSKAVIDELARKLENHFLSNRDENIFFSLLGGLPDADSETLPTDAELLAYAQLMVAELNKRYPRKQGLRFFFLPRSRRWNPQEGVFMEWERKRGKLRELNKLLRGDTQTSYQLTEAQRRAIPKDIVYVITLDEDTQLLRESASELIGCISHPLHRPYFDEARGVITEGYGIIQPAVTVELDSAHRSVFSRFFSFTVGLDPYSTTSTDLYHDLFGAGIFYGKGIYDIDIIEQVMADKIPENLVLSHDLLEGIYARVGMATDIQIFEKFPQRYHEYMRRLNRHIRGDWQIVSWILRAKERFAVIDRWKIADNLRRSLIRPALLLILIASWAGVVTGLWFWQIGVAIFLSLPILLQWLLRFSQFTTNEHPKRYLLLIKELLATILGRILLQASFLLHQTIVTLGAIGSALVRQLVTKRKLLEWDSASAVAARASDRLHEVALALWSTQPIGLFLVAAALLITDRMMSVVLAAWGLLWLASPLFAYLISQNEYGKDGETRAPDISARQERFLRMVACRTARFFIEHGLPEYHWLIPDNLSEQRHNQIQTTTSPTNIGMQLLSLLASYEFGYLGLKDFEHRISATMGALESMERWRGHFFNWYDLKTKNPVFPKYVSSVDSANFSLSLLLLAQGLRSLTQTPLVDTAMLQGIQDMLLATRDSAEDLLKISHDAEKKIVLQRIIKEAAQLAKELEWQAPRPAELLLFLDKLASKRVEWQTLLEEVAVRHGIEEFFDIDYWLLRLGKADEQIRALIDSLLPFATAAALSAPVQHEPGSEQFARQLHVFTDAVGTPVSLAELADGRFVARLDSLDLYNSIKDSQLPLITKEALRTWLSDLMRSVQESGRQAAGEIERFAGLETRCQQLFEEADFSFLYNPERGLFRVGYNAAFETMDTVHYNLMASETNIISLIAILKNQAPKKHWFYLSRKLINGRGRPLLSSWGGSLFEYLTTLLFFKTSPLSVLGATATNATRAHIKYGARHGVPWGIGESAYDTLDINQNYQYQVFGVPELGLKRNLNNYLVAAPYTTFLALPFTKPSRAVANLRRMMRRGMFSRYGFYDALDFSKDSHKKRARGVRAEVHYAHHQGFIMAALLNTLRDNRLHKLSEADPRLRSVALLLDEKMPNVVPPKTRVLRNHLPLKYLPASSSESDPHRTPDAFAGEPEYAYLGNGSWQTVISSAGVGRSSYLQTELFKGEDDFVLERGGLALYIRDKASGEIWSPTPLPVAGGKYAVQFKENAAVFTTERGTLESELFVTVAPDEPVEIRELTLTNSGETLYTLEVASYGEVALAEPGQIRHHPMFQKLFVRAEPDQKNEAIIFSRNDRSNSSSNGNTEKKRGEGITLGHTLTKLGKADAELRVLREDCVDRSGSLSTPLLFQRATQEGIPNYPLDPVASLKKTVVVPAGKSVRLAFITAVAPTADALRVLLKKYRDEASSHGVVKNTNKQSSRTLAKLATASQDALVFQELLSRVMTGRRKPGQSSNQSLENGTIAALWQHGLTGTLPLLVAKVHDLEDIWFARRLLAFEQYARYKGVTLDIAILNDYPVGYIKALEDEIDFIISYNRSSVKESLGGIYHIRTKLIQPEEEAMIRSAASVELDSKQGSLSDQLKRLVVPTDAVPVVPLVARAGQRAKPQASLSKLSADLPAKLFENGYGGFDPETSEYCMTLTDQDRSPVAWANIIGRPNFGTIVTAEGNATTWSIDSYDNRLTPWHNDVLVERTGEYLYLRDDSTGEFWSATPAPARRGHNYEVRHGRGYSTFSTAHEKIRQDLMVTVAVNDTVKIQKLSLTNKGDEDCRLSLFTLIEPTLGPQRDTTRHGLRIWTDDSLGAIFMQNPLRNDLAGRVAFVFVSSGMISFSNDRHEFFGHCGSPEAPAALSNDRLSGAIDQPVDPAAAMQSTIKLPAGSTVEITILLGDAESEVAARELIERYGARPAIESRSETSAVWDELSEGVAIKTPDKSLDLLGNTWLLYQTASARLFGKTGLYQPSGAYGFRDQLQDVMAFVWTRPEIVREHILRAARHQFQEGDVMAWWHEHNNFGVRALFSDHALWLPYVLSFYVTHTGDYAILNEELPFLIAPVPHFIERPEWLGVPETTTESHSLYEHAVRAIEHSLRFGEHGLPLIGKGDWNDGLNNAGVRGRGESVWLGWFLFTVLDQFEPVAKQRSDMERARRFVDIKTGLQTALEDHAWDGKWYKRAYLDNGAPLGSSLNDEFRIDSIAQSWAVLSGASKPERAALAIDSALALLSPDKQFIRLLTPPLEKSELNPGYLKDYPPGVRENGAQYNHAAIWLVQALCRQGRGDDAMALLDLINPIKRSDSKEKADRYRVEPYVVSSEVYTEPSYAGRGGWTWYTGSAGLFYRTLVEYIFGLKKQGALLQIEPCIPSSWKECEITYRYGQTDYVITIENPLGKCSGVRAVFIDSTQTRGNTLELEDDQVEHQVRVVLR